MSVQANLVTESVTDGLDSCSYVLTYVILDDAGGAVGYAQALGVMTALSATAVVNGKTLIVKSRSIQREPDSLLKVWRGTVNYEWSASDGDNSGSATSFVSIDLSSSTSFVDVYRVGATLPAYNAGNSDTDIGGTAVDSCGVPVSALLNQQEMTVTNIRSTNNASAILAALGNRNSTSFLGASQGYVLFTGASSRRTGVNLYEIQYRFLWDGAAHWRQACARDVDGQPLLAAPGGNGAAKASLVYARQPFPNLNDFSGLSISTS